MKKQFTGFLTGVVVTMLIGTLGVGALAATGQLTLTVNPINIQVNGQTFAPKDAKGNSVPVFEYNGTTYAPLRALAEAYGLEVGYDAEKQIATVGEKGSAAPPQNDNTPLNVNDYSSPMYISDTYTLYVNPDAVYENGTTIVNSYDAKYDLGMITSKAGKYSNMATNYLLADMLFTEFPQYQDELISEINNGLISCVSYSDAVYIDCVNAIQFFRGKGIEIYGYGNYFLEIKDK